MGGMEPRAAADRHSDVVRRSRWVLPSAMLLMAVNACTGDDGPSAEERSNDGVVASDAVEGDAGRTVVLTGMRARDAFIRGRLTTVGNCAGIEGSPVIWPTGTVAIGESPLVLRIPGLGEVRAGERLQGHASILDAATDNLSVEVPESCGTTRVVVFGVEP